MSSNNSTVNAFADVVRRFSYKGKGPKALPLTNITFFVGAGFSKSWRIKRLPESGARNTALAGGNNGETAGFRFDL